MKPSVDQMKHHLARIQNPTAIDIAWAAGIYEGEGYSQVQGGAVVAQKEPWILYKMRDKFGGSVHCRSDGGQWRWMVCGARMRGFLQTIYVFLSPRRQEQIRKTLQVGEFS